MRQFSNLDTKADLVKINKKSFDLPAWRPESVGELPVLSLGRLTVAIFSATGLYYLILSLLIPLQIGILAPWAHGMTFNSMALYLLEGRFDVDPAAIGDEGFFRDGRTYAYFGILPAILRMPLVPFVDLRHIQVEPFYRFLAMMSAAGGGLLLATALRRMGRGGADLGHILFLNAALFSGPTIMIGPRPDIFNEVTLIAYALAVMFVAVLFPLLASDRKSSPCRLAALAVLAGLALLTRATTGLGLASALALLLIALTWQNREEAGVRGFLRAALDRRIMVPIGIVLLFVAMTLGVNYARWENPLTFADLRFQTALQASFPDRLPRLEAYGLFSLERLPLGLVYYFLPIWAFTRDGRFLFQDDIARLFDGFELPPTSFFLTDPLTMLLAAIGLLALARDGIPGVRRGPALAALAGLAVAPLLMLIAWYMAFRYRMEFMPFLLLAAALGVLRLGEWMAAVSPKAARRAALALTVLLVLQVASAHVHALLYLASPWGPSLRFAAEGLPAYYLSILMGR